jgi:hypothetical protein
VGSKHVANSAHIDMTNRPHVRPDEVREREHRVEMARFHRAHVIELTYFSIICAVALGTISFFIDQDWAWFLRGMVGGLIVTSLYILGRALHHPIRKYFLRRRAARIEPDAERTHEDLSKTAAPHHADDSADGIATETESVKHST